MACWTHAAEAGQYVHIRVEGVINPIKARHVRQALAFAEREQAELLLVSIDTPGGLVSSMRDITTALTNARVPVVGFVEPTSAQATSAGAFILLATDVAAMMPHTIVGAAHPVGPGGDLGRVLDEKATNSLASLAKSLAARRGRSQRVAESIVRQSHSYTAEEALAKGAIELIATDVGDLLRRLDGRKLTYPGRTLTLRTRDLDPVPLPLSWPERALDAIADPTIASILLTLGVLSILYELAAPGIGMAGIVGVIALLTGLAAMSVLSLELGGVLLLAAGLTALVVEVKAQTHGMIAAGGVVALVLGALLLVDPSSYYGAAQTVDWRLLGPFIAVTALAFVLLARAALRIFRLPFQTGIEALVGRQGRAKSAFLLDGALYHGSVFVDGAAWEGVSDVAVHDGDRVEVVGVLQEPTRLEVKPHMQQGAVL